MDYETTEDNASPTTTVVRPVMDIQPPTSSAVSAPPAPAPVAEQEAEEPEAPAPLSPGTSVVPPPDTPAPIEAPPSLPPPKANHSVLIAVIVAILVAVVLAGLAVFAYLKDREIKTTPATSQTVTPKVTTGEVDQTTKAIDEDLSSATEKDFDANDLSDSALGL